MKNDQPISNETPRELISAEEACNDAGISANTLYSYVSRGLVRAIADPEDSRRSLYNRRDVEALIMRKTRSRARADIAHSTINWGEPIIRSDVSKIEDGRLYYRKKDAVKLAQKSNLENVAKLLTGLEFCDTNRRPVMGDHRFHDQLSNQPLIRIMDVLSNEVIIDKIDNDNTDHIINLMKHIIAAGGGVTPHLGESIHDQVARGLGAPSDKADIIRQALILCADHELNPSCYAARIAASTGVNTASALLAGTAAFNGPKHGLMPEYCAKWLDRSPQELGEADENISFPGFGHRLYPDGDIRAKALLKICPASDAWQRTADFIFEKFDDQPNITFALACVERELSLTQGAASALYVIGRSFGWLAHILEQRASGEKIRPRAFS